MKNQNNINGIAFSENVIGFITVANEFCKFIENTLNLEKKEFIDKALKITSLLYFKSINLPKINDIEGEGVEKFISEADWHYIDQKVSSKLGDDEVFTELCEPNSSEIINVSISECFADIYQDLKDFTMLYQIGNEESIIEGIWECRQSFEHIWGPRVLIVMKELHNLLFSDKDLEDSVRPAAGESITGQRNWVHDMFSNNE